MPSYTTRLMKRLPAAGDGLTPETEWTADWHDNEKIDDVVLSALLSGNRVTSGGAVTAGAGLVVDYAALVAAVAGISFSIAAGNKTCTAAASGQEQGNWLYVSSAGVVTISTTPPAGEFVPLARIDASDTAVIRIADLRPRAVAATGHRNKLRNGDFSVNQRAVSGTVVLAGGARGHDCWKAGGAGCTFAITPGVPGISITAGSLVQVVEGLFLQSGIHCLSWGGTAQGRIDGGSMGVSGITGTAVGGTNVSIEFGTGTLFAVQFEPGDRPSLFEFRLNELQLCQRYLPGLSGTIALVGFASSTTAGYFHWPYPVRPRVKPTGIEIPALADFTVLNFVNVDTGTPTALGLHSTSGNDSGLIVPTTTAGAPTLAVGNPCRLTSSSTRILFTGAEL